MTLRRLPTILIGALLICAGCQHAAMWRSSYVPPDAAPPVAAVPENRYWSAPPISPGEESAARNLANDRAAKTVSFSQRAESPSEFANDGPSFDGTASDGTANSPDNKAAPVLPGSVAENFASTLEPPDEPMSRGQHFRNDLHCLWPEIKQDYANYYSWHNAAWLAVGFGIAAPLANTDVDQKIRDWYQTDVRSADTDKFAKIAKGFGTGGYVIPGVVAVWLTGEMFYDTPCGDALSQWGLRTMRAAAVGTPPMLLMQYVTGGSRPSDPHPHSDWRPFNDNNGVSGHSFICGLVFIDAAKMSDELPVKMGFYALSTMAGWSRVNDDAHYTSQVILGWWMAYCEATAVDNTNHQESNWSIMPLPMIDGAGMAITYQY